MSTEDSEQPGVDPELVRARQAAPCFICPRCSRRSFNRKDGSELYCGACKAFFVGRAAFVYRWLGGDVENVMVFDGAGNQIAELQGDYRQVREKVIAAAEAATTFFHGLWRQGYTPVDRGTW